MRGGERTAEERERARLEREARRAAREGRPAPEAPPPTEVPPPPVDTPEEPRVRRVERSHPAAPAARPEPTPKAQPAPEFVPAPEPEPRLEPEPPVEPEPLPDPEPTPAPQAAAARPRPPAPFRPEPARRSVREARSVKAQSVLDRRRAGSRSSSPRSRTHRRGRLVALGTAGLLGLVVLWFLFSLYQPFAGEGEGTVAVRIPSGAGVGEIADLLAERGVVSSAFFFRARATITGRAGDFKAGRFALREDMSYASAMDALAESPDAQTVSVTIPEGRARSEVRDLVKGDLEGDYLALTRRSPLLDPRDYGARNATDLEGFLFPATYELKRGQGAKELVRQQLEAFEREFAKVDMRFANSKNLSRYDVLVIASMVEREAQLAKERPVIASVIYNRLREGIPLGIDATVRFATGNWDQPLTESQLAVDSPYNTRELQDLPPGPIGSPGLSSIQAAANPDDTDFIYYVVKPNTCGVHDFSVTLDEHNSKVARYEDERAARGGRSPTDC